MCEVYQTTYETLWVALKTPDNLAADFSNSPINLLKIDVAGFELEVLKGANLNKVSPCGNGLSASNKSAKTRAPKM